MAINRAGSSTTETASQKVSGTQAHQQSPSADGHFIRVKNGHPVAGALWAVLPQEMGCGSGMTCWRRLRDWQEAGVWDRLHQLVLSLLQQEGELDWSLAVVDSSSVRAIGAGKKQGQVRLTGAKPAPNTIC